MKLFSSAFISPLLLGNGVIEQETSSKCLNAITVPSSIDDGVWNVAQNVPASLIRSSSDTYINGYMNTRQESSLMAGIKEWMLPSANAAETGPTNAQIELLRKAFAALYNEGGSPETALPLLDQAVDAWSNQAVDEKAGLYRVRGDCHLRLFQTAEAMKDYSKAIDLLEGPDGDLADPAERPAARLGRARAIMSVKGNMQLTKSSAQMAAEDYRISLKLSSREDWDTDEENVQDGAQRNPYAAWEMGTAQRLAGDFSGAYTSHVLASDAFESIGDHARAVISSLDAGIDLAATGDVATATKVLEPAIKSSVGVESRDVELLERVVSKEGEARIALASLLWNSNDNKKQQAESLLGEVSQIKFRKDEIYSELLIHFLNIYTGIFLFLGLLKTRSA